MKKSLIFGVAAMVLASCNSPGEDSSQTGSLVFETGKISFSSETLESVCFDEQGKNQIFMVLFRPETAEIFSKLTSENVNRSMQMVLGEKVISTPNILEPISGIAPIALYSTGKGSKNRTEMEVFFGVGEIPPC